jgi:hypothetical protein
MKEIWKNIKNFENIYQISNLGNVKALEREYYCGNNFKVKKIHKEQPIKGYIEKNGYKIVCLKNLDNKRTVRVHRLVAEHFILNSENKPEVNHINGIKTDNRAENLE